MSVVSSATLLPRTPRVLADLVPRVLARDAVLVAGGALLTGVAAQVAIPVPGTPVPLTLQTLAALLVGAALGWRRGLTSLALYALVGIAGVPWFADGKSGWQLASFGYIVGFVLAAGLVGWLAERGVDRRVLPAALAMVAGNVVIYACGVPVLMGATGMDLRPALSAGVVPFLLTDLIKIVAAAGVLPATWALVRRIRSEP